jgi:hypothetical protein
LTSADSILDGAMRVTSKYTIRGSWLCSALWFMGIHATDLSAADWLTFPGRYSHDASGQRVVQYAEKVEPVAPHAADFQESGFRHFRSSIQVGQSADNYYRVQSWGPPVRPYGEWQFPYRPYSVPYDQWGPQPGPFGPTVMPGMMQPGMMPAGMPPQNPGAAQSPGFLQRLLHPWRGATANPGQVAPSPWQTAPTGMAAPSGMAGPTWGGAPDPSAPWVDGYHGDAPD